MSFFSLFESKTFKYHFLPNQRKTIEVLLSKLSYNGKLLIKFDHFNKDKLSSLLLNSHCSDKKEIEKNCWVLSK